MERATQNNTDDKASGAPGSLAGLTRRVEAVLAGLADARLAPALYLVATPIGNLADISLRALHVLAEADIIACEDTRHSRKLLTHYDLKGRLTPYHEHNAAAARPKLIGALKEGARVALISDAGTPLISDPGYKLVREAAEAGISVTAIPGASASLAALSTSGLPTDSFFFAGFLPPKTAGRKARLAALAAIPATLIFYESAPRLAAALADMAEVLGPREAAIAKELTKLHEHIARGSLDGLAADVAASASPRGEYVLLVGPPANDAAAIDDATIVARLTEALKTESLRDAVRRVSAEIGAKRSRVYRLGLSLGKPEA